MALRKQTGNMYSFVTHTWNPIKGKCSHDCHYCYMKKFKLGDLRLDEKDLQTELGDGKFIFVGSSTDMWAKDVPDEWIAQVLRAIGEHNLNTYLFQSKDPSRFIDFMPLYASHRLFFGTTMETNRKNDFSRAPSVRERSHYLNKFKSLWGNVKPMVTIEPIMDFDLKPMVHLIKEAEPTWVNIGADSKGHGLPEPSADKIANLIGELERFTLVKEKSNLKRLTKG